MTPSRLLAEIRVNMQTVLFRDQMYSLFNRLKSKRKRVIAERQIRILTLLLERDYILDELEVATGNMYTPLKNPGKALVRDINGLLQLGAIHYRIVKDNEYQFFVRREWPTEITETEFFRRVEQMPTAKTHRFLDH